MNVRERLTQLAKLDNLIGFKITQYESAKKRATSDFYSGGGKRLANEINADIDRLCDEKQALMQMIDNTPALTVDELKVLYKHYLEGKSYDVIAKELYWAKTSVFRTCKRAVQKVADQWENT